MIELPIDQIRAEFNTALTCVTHLLISAEPGAGKSTRLPLWALQHPALDELRIFLIQPRRLAAASVAEYLADQCGSRVGEIIGLRTRDEIKTSRCTRLEVMTPGMYLRVLQSDPELTGVAMVIFDEFHERSAQMDLGLALTLLSNDLFRGDDSVRVVVMSATLAIEPLVQYLPNIRLLACGGKTFPVSTEYKAKPARMTQEQHTAATIRATLTSYDGDLLVFLPGIRAIKWVADELGETTGIAVHMLHSSVPLKEQRAAIAPAAAGLRKVVLATNIAETSLTIEGIKVVIDSGLARQAVFDSSRGVTQLITGSISQAAAEQRKGRAGRVSEGHCIRLWDRQQHGRLRPFDLPELLTGDLAPTLLEATLFGEPHLGKLVLLDQPPAIAIERSWRELEQLGAVTRERRVTAHGERMAALGLAPALASMCVTAEGYGPEALKLACVLATVINEAVVLPAGADARR